MKGVPKTPIRRSPLHLEQPASDSASSSPRSLFSEDSLPEEPAPPQQEAMALNAGQLESALRALLINSPDLLKDLSKPTAYKGASGRRRYQLWLKEHSELKDRETLFLTDCVAIEDAGERQEFMEWRRVHKLFHSAFHSWPLSDAAIMEDSLPLKPNMVTVTDAATLEWVNTYRLAFPPPKPRAREKGKKRPRRRPKKEQAQPPTVAGPPTSTPTVKKETKERKKKDG